MQPQPMQSQPEVVLVEDDAGMREAIARMLRGAGFGVRAFASAESLFAQVRDGPLPAAVACCICDVHLPGACGFELQRLVAAHGSSPQWIFITAHDDPALRAQAERANASYLPKPFEGRALLALVTRALADAQRATTPRPDSVAPGGNT